jgi:hypothetical protein
MWRTPVARDHHPSGTGHLPKKTIQLAHQIQGNLNPEWVEALMGFPVGYTDINGPQVQENHSIPGNLLELSLQNSLTEQNV